MPSFHFRSITDEDRDFLLAVYASTRSEEMKLVDWDDQQKAAFLEMQFSLQHQYYQEQYAKNAQFLIILLGDLQIGRLYVNREEKEIHIIDLALLPEFRNAGYGTKILQEVFTEAASSEKFVSIYVERFNPALKLYRRLGFIKKGEHGYYDLMEWLPTTAQVTTN